MAEHSQTIRYALANSSSQVPSTPRNIIDSASRRLKNGKRLLRIRKALCWSILKWRSVLEQKDIDMDLVSWTVQNDAVFSEQEIFVDAMNPSNCLSKRQICSLIRRIVGGFHSENGGVRLHGDTICVHDFNNIFYPVLFQAIIGAGGCFTGVNPAYTKSELQHHFRLSRTRFVITSQALVSQALAAAEDSNIPKSSIFVFHQEEILGLLTSDIGFGRSRNSTADSVVDPPTTSCVQSVTECRSFLELIEQDEPQWCSFKSNKLSRTTPAALFSTSGTSGLPKIAIRSHASLMTEVSAITDRTKKPYSIVRLLCVPFFHAFASPLANIAAIREGEKTYVMPRYNEEEFLEAVEKYSVTETALPPPVLLNLREKQSDRMRRQLKSVRTVWCGGAPLDGRLQQSVAHELLHEEARIVQVWGLTECGWLTTFPYPERDTTGSVGRMLPGYNSKLLNDEGIEVHKDRGELVIKSSSMMQGYLGENAATRAAFTKDGFYRTGDVGKIHHGKVYIVDRKKELIKVRGWQVAPAELEGILIQHPRISDAAVIGVPRNHESNEEVPEAHVVRTGSSQLTESEIKRFLLHYLAKYKVRDCRIVFTEAIPKNASGKILRKVLKQRRTEAITLL